MKYITLILHEEERLQLIDLYGEANNWNVETSQ